MTWKVGKEFLPFHPDASHVPPDYRDGWNACYEAARASGAAVVVPASPAAPESERETLNRLARKFDLDNHHNAALCPYCSPAAPPPEKELGESKKNQQNSGPEVVACHNGCRPPSVCSECPSMAHPVVSDVAALVNENERLHRVIGSLRATFIVNMLRHTDFPKSEIAAAVDDIAPREFAGSAPEARAEEASPTERGVDHDDRT